MDGSSKICGHMTNLFYGFLETRGTTRFIQDLFRDFSGVIQGFFMGYSGLIQRLFRFFQGYSVVIQGFFRGYSGVIQELFRGFRELFKSYSKVIQG